MEYSEEEDIGEVDEVEFSKEVLALLKKERKTLRESGFDVDKAIEEIERGLEEVADAKAQVDDLKRRQLMSMSESLIKEKEPVIAGVAHLDAASNNLRADEDVLEHYRRQRRSPRNQKKREEEADGIGGSN